MTTAKRLILLLSLLGALGAYPGLAAADEAEDVASHLTAQAQNFLDSILGPGRSKVLIAVEVDKTNTETHSEIFKPVVAQKKEESVDLSMPGYTVEQPKTKVEEAPDADKKNWDFLQKNTQQSTELSGLVIRRMRVSVILDSGLSAEKADTVSHIIPDLLHIDTARGDELAIVRAPLLPEWKTMAASAISPEVLRLGLLFFALLLLLIVASMLAYFLGTRLLRAFAFEFTSKRKEIPELPAGQGEPLPDFLPGGIPSLEGPKDEQEHEEGETVEAGVPALGRRFDYLSSKEPSEIASLLSDEPPFDIALMFGYLADSNPDLASSIFSAMSSRLQSTVSQALAGLKIADPERLAMLETKLRNLVEFGVRGPERLGKILSRLGQDERDEIIQNIMAASPEAAEEVERALFAFEELESLSTNDFRRLLVAVSYKEWGLALRGAPDGLVKMVLELLLPGTRNLIQEAMETPQPRVKVLEARSHILSQTLAMASRGEIVLKRKGASSEMI